MELDTKISTLPKTIHGKLIEFIDVLVHNYSVEKEIPESPKEEDLDKKKLDLILEMLFITDWELIKNIDLIINQNKTPITEWEKEMLVEGLKDLEAGRLIPHDKVMKEMRELLK